MDPQMGDWASTPAGLYHTRLVKKYRFEVFPVVEVLAQEHISGTFERAKFRIAL